MMELIGSINWVIVAWVVLAIFFSFNTYQIVKYTLVKRKAEKELKEIDVKIAELTKKYEETKAGLMDKVQNIIDYNTAPDKAPDDKTKSK